MNKIFKLELFVIGVAIIVIVNDGWIYNRLREQVNSLSQELKVLQEQVTELSQVNKPIIKNKK